MPALSVALPLKPGKGEDLRRFIETLRSHQSEQHHAKRRSAGFTRIRYYHQHIPQDMLVVSMEAADIAAATKAAFPSNEQDEHDNFVARTLHELTGLHMYEFFAAHPAELLVDWHPEHGHKPGHHD